VYSFTVPRDGRYRFELYDMRKGLAPEIQVYDRLGEPDQEGLKAEAEVYITSPADSLRYLQ